MQANLITKTDFGSKLSNLNRKITKNKTDHLLVQNYLNKLKTFDSGYFIGKGHFEVGGTQNYLAFQPVNKYLNCIPIHYISLWKSKGLSSKTIDPLTANLSPLINNVGNKIRVKFTGSCLKQSNKLTYTMEK